MTINKSRTAAVLAAAAASSMIVSPAMAQGWGWGNDWGHGRHHRDGIDAGDVLTGILIIGGIAAIASAASSGNHNRRQNDERRSSDEDYPVQQPQHDYAPAASSPSWSEGGIGNAVDRCMGEVGANDGRDGVDQVSRAGQGWRVQGHTGDGKGFTCVVDGNGRIRNISVEGESY